MSTPREKSRKTNDEGGMITQALRALVANVPLSHEKVSPHPAERAERLAVRAAFNAAALSGTAALPPGPLGLATIFPDLLGVWRLQQQMVADIAAVYGRSAALTPEAMVLCLFQHADPAVAQTLAKSHGRVATRGVAQQTLQLLLEKIAIRVGQRLVRKSIARWVPIVGALGVGAHAYHDTSKVAQNTIRLLTARPNAAPGQRGTRRATASRPAGGKAGRVKPRAGGGKRPRRTRAAKKASPPTR